ncbi:L-histidine N(alpha)-methyltransferase [Roseiconus nitratireducens]|uniref:L-histidine N(Alpha)-methyltransferase n=1 Tax=Roseiconus nitratireducens TaxID=2605748 RepID=A0A5M6D351_9BACT|nr:L-histidine N(alpha)-methyltransferase [Roseiconus nitratireducens]KAA5539605.1 L-histidine N(alpha)-methyltransferase [Roseiconus nitratireducens]
MPVGTSPVGTSSAGQTTTIPEPRSLSDDAQLREDVLAGLSEMPRVLSSKYFYDKRGSSLFDSICSLPEYYPTRTETEIMERDAGAMVSQIGEDVCIVEYGSGSSVKTRLLLDQVGPRASYVPVDISGKHLAQTAEELSDRYPRMPITPVVADFTQPFELPGWVAEHENVCFYFPGSTIGNFTPDEAVDLLRRMRCQGQTASNEPSKTGLLIGVDLHKDTGVLEAAYNDREGVTAEFNKNMLVRINRELGADFDLDQFGHTAIYNEAARRIEMRLVSLTHQTVHLCGRSFEFGCGQTIRTEYSHKYTLDGFTQLAETAGWSVRQAWTDPQSRFSVLFFRAAESDDT